MAHRLRGRLIPRPPPIVFWIFLNSKFWKVEPIKKLTKCYSIVNNDIDWILSTKNVIQKIWFGQWRKRTETSLIWLCRRIMISNWILNLPSNYKQMSTWKHSSRSYTILMYVYQVRPQSKAKYSYTLYLLQNWNKIP